jgi:hypothetical protein
MTYVLGMRCLDGLVLCADSMEGDSIGKHYVQKLHVGGVDGQWGICWGCSGSGDVIRKFNSAVREALAKQPYDKGAIEQAIEGCLKFVKQSYPDTDRIYVIAGLYGLSADRGAEFGLYRGYSDSICFAPEKNTQ